MIYILLLPGCQGANDNHLRKFGLESLATDCGPSWFELSDGPESGIACTWLKGVTNLDPNLDDLSGFEWTQSPPVDGRRYWLGINQESPPTPMDLERKKTIRGNLVNLRDGNQWMAPSARYLPCLHGINNETGEYETKFDEKFVEYCRSAAEHAKGFFDREEQIRALAKMSNLSEEQLKEATFEIPLHDSWNQTVRALSINYRLNDFILSSMELIGNSEMIACCTAAFDLQAIVNIKKKEDWESSLGIPLGSTI